MGGCWVNELSDAAVRLNYPEGDPLEMRGYTREEWAQIITENQRYVATLEAGAIDEKVETLLSE